jgi:DtxR family Mn-dependent transcriptional regulator
MDTVEREDTLLSLMRLSERTGQSTGPDDLANQTGISVQNIEKFLNLLVDSGDVESDGKGGYSLTEKGRSDAETVMRRHHILETFLQEMLGMDHEKAHEQACTMEHHTSDDTINRLRKFLRTSRDCPGPCQGHHQYHACKTLADCRPNEQVVIEGIKGCGRALRLADLGLVPGQQVRVLERMANTMLIRVKDCDIAISPEIARSVLVEVDL